MPLLSRRRSVCAALAAGVLLAVALPGGTSLARTAPPPARPTAAPAAAASSGVDTRPCPAGTHRERGLGCVRQVRSDHADGHDHGPDLEIVTDRGTVVPTHGLDPYPSARTAGAAGDQLPTSSAGYVCATPDEHRLQLVYAVPSDRPDRYDAVGASSVTHEFYWAADKLLSESTGLGQEVRYRVACDATGHPAVAHVVLSVPDAMADFSAVAAGVRAAGLTERVKTKYAVWVDGTLVNGGLGTLASDDRLTSDNKSVENPYADASYAMVWNGGPCCGGTPTAAEVLMHEIGHTMGAVQDSAPHSTGAGHCTDGQDVMCYDDGGPRGGAYSSVACPTSTPFDCGHDDFFSPAAVTPASSYLASHWNLGNPLNLFLRCRAVRPGPRRCAG